MKKVLAVLAASLSLSMSFSAFAGTWRQDAKSRCKMAGSYAIGKVGA